jgi:hypothetical protein
MQQHRPGASHEDKVVLLCAPVHDRLTEYTSMLLENFPSLGARTILCKFQEPLTYDQLLERLSLDQSTDITVIFCGHGEKPSLQGPGAEPNEPDYEKIRSAFYRDSFLDLGPNRMLAACCYAAAGLGQAFYDETENTRFVGFEDKIGFVLEGGVYEDWWRKILHGLASAMLNASDINDMKKSAQQVYKSAIRFFGSNAQRKYRYGYMMRAYLRQQLELIKFIET